MGEGLDALLRPLLSAGVHSLRDTLNPWMAAVRDWLQSLQLWRPVSTCGFVINVQPSHLAVSLGMKISMMGIYLGQIRMTTQTTELMWTTSATGVSS